MGNTVRQDNLWELKAPQSFWPEGVKDDEFRICRCLSEGYRSGPSARLDCTGTFVVAVAQKRCRCIVPVKKLHETDLAVSDLETHQYLDQLLYRIPVLDQLVPLLCECL